MLLQSEVYSFITERGLPVTIDRLGLSLTQSQWRWREGGKSHLAPSIQRIIYRKIINHTTLTSLRGSRDRIGRVSWVISALTEMNAIRISNTGLTSTHRRYSFITKRCDYTTIMKTCRNDIWCFTKPRLPRFAMKDLLVLPQTPPWWSQDGDTKNFEQRHQG